MNIARLMMGQHKTNPNSILKAQGKLQPKRNITAREQKETLQSAFTSALLRALSKEKTNA